MSNRRVLEITFLLAIGAGVLLLLARAMWRRVAWWRQYRKYSSSSRAAQERGAVLRARPVVMDPWPEDAKVNGANGAASDDEPSTIVSGADVSTRR